MTGTMPSEPRPAAMTPEELKRLVAEAGYAESSPADVAKLIGIARNTYWRWLTGKTPISRGNALLVRDKLKVTKG